MVIFVIQLMEVSPMITHMLEVLPHMIVTLGLDWWVMYNEYVEKVVTGMEQIQDVNVSYIVVYNLRLLAYQVYPMKFVVLMDTR